MLKLIGDSRNLPDLLADWCAGPGTMYPGQPLPIPGTVPCIVGSPPYNVAIPNYPSGYHDRVPWQFYKSHAYRWAKAIHDTLCPGGRAWIVVQPTVPKVPGETGGERVNLAQIWCQALSAARLHFRDIVVWKQDSFDGGCAWGSWRKPSAPNLRGSHEFILVYYKDHWARRIPEQWKGWEDKEDDTGGEWVQLVRNVWDIPPANPGTWHHKDPDNPGKAIKLPNLPALYPSDIPRRAIRLSTWPGEWVVDPWAGHCTTGLAASELLRPSIMVDLGYGEK